MEMKYLVQQDNNDISFPLVHVNSIVGLDVNPSTTVSGQDIVLTSIYLVTGSKAKIMYFDNITYLTADIQLNAEGIKYLQENNVLELTSTALNNTEDVVLDCITTNKGEVSNAAGYIWLKNSILYVSAVCKDKTFVQNPDNPLEVIEGDTINAFDRIVGNALSTTKSFAPIKPIVPDGYITLTFSQRVENISLIIEHINPIEITTDHGKLTYSDREGKFYTVNVTNTTKDYTIMIKGNISYVVYPQAINVFAVTIKDCGNLRWFGVKDKSSTNTTMSQNTSIKKFSIEGRHKMFDMTNFLSGLIDLETVDNFSTIGVINMSKCFKGCGKLKTLPSMEFATVIYAESMCFGCTSLAYIPDLNYNAVVDATNMFNGCISIASTPNVMNMTSLVYADYMLSKCSKLSKLALVVPKLSSTSNMLMGCSSLYGLTMANLTSDINLRDTIMRDKESVELFMSKVGIAPYDKPAAAYLPQAVGIYGFTNSFLKTVSDKNWGLK